MDAGPMADAGTTDAGADAGAAGEAGTADAGAVEDAGTNSPQSAPRLRGSLCDVDGWCWESPLPQGNRLVAVATASPDEIWFGGTFGTLFRWTPSGFEGTIGELTRDPITGLYARSPGDVWAATRSVVFHFDGTRWATSLDLSATSYPPLSQLAGTPDGAVFAVGRSSAFLFDGERWPDIGVPPSSEIQAFWAASGSSAYASVHADTGYQVLHWDGTSWTADFDGGGPLFAIWGSSASDIWAAGQGLRILHRDASGWSEVQPGSTDTESSSSGLGTLFGSGADDVWALGSRSTWARASGCTGQQGIVQHWDGTRWSPIWIDWNGGDCWLNSDILWTGASAGPGKAWLAGERGAIAFASASGTTRMSTPAGLVGIWGPSPDRVYATRGSRVLRREESGWTPHRSTDPNVSLGSLHGAGDELVAANFGYIGVGVHFAGDGTAVPSSAPIIDSTAVWMTGDRQAWIAGRPSGNQPATMLHWDGARWISTEIQGDPGLAMFATSPLDVWAGGPDGNAFHFDGTEWKDVSYAAEPTTSVIGFWRDAGGAIHLAGNNSRHPFARWNGLSWEATDLPAPVKFVSSFWPAGDDDFWLTGEPDQLPQQSRVYHVHHGRIDDAHVPDYFWFDGRVFGVGSDAWLYSGPGGLTVHRTFETR